MLNGTLNTTVTTQLYATHCKNNKKPMLSKRNSAMQRVIYQTPIPPGNLWWWSPWSRSVLLCHSQ